MEVCNPDGTVKSGVFYDEKGRWLNRQDFDHDHYVKEIQQNCQSHEHSCHYNVNGCSDGVWDDLLHQDIIIFPHNKEHRQNELFFIWFF